MGIDVKMEINLKMDISEFQEFMAYREEKGKYAAALIRIKNAPLSISASLVHAVEPVKARPGKWKIVDQEHMDDAMRLASECLELGDD